MLYRLLSWLFWLPDKFGTVARKIRSWAERKRLLANALTPGTKVTTTCSCHAGKVWYVEEYSVEYDCYTIIENWPPPTSHCGLRHDVDYISNIERKTLALATEP